MTPTHHSRIATTLRAALPVSLMAGLAVILLRFPPAQYTFYPQCPIYSSLHLLCPGCGGTRALAVLLQGHLHEALQYNALVTLLLPIAFVYGTVNYTRFLQRQPLRWPEIPSAAIHATLAVAVVFTVLRNLP